MKKKHRRSGPSFFCTPTAPLAPVLETKQNGIFRRSTCAYRSSAPAISPDGVYLQAARQRRDDFIFYPLSCWIKRASICPETPSLCRAASARMVPSRSMSTAVTPSASSGLSHDERSSSSGTMERGP